MLVEKGGVKLSNECVVPCIPPSLLNYICHIGLDCLHHPSYQGHVQVCVQGLVMAVL